jgi:isoquinoline 1-oxidoreductase beta subunit
MFREPQALAARRTFLKGSGCLTFALATGGAVRVMAASAQPGVEPFAVNAWVTITADDVVTIKLGAAEMGQGVMTAVPAILAEGARRAGHP